MVSPVKSAAVQFRNAVSASVDSRSAASNFHAVLLTLPDSVPSVIAVASSSVMPTKPPILPEKVPV